MAKRIYVMVVMAITATGAWAQLPTLVIDTALGTMTSLNQVTNIVQFTQTAFQTYQNAMNTWEQLQRTVEAEKKALENLKDFGKIKSWSDFTTWSNRQLSLDRAAEDKLKSTKLVVGNSKVSLMDIENLPDAVANGTVDWVGMLGRELTDSEKAAIWAKEGISPANYYYSQSVKARSAGLLKKMSTGTDVENDDQVKTNEALKSEMDQLANLDSNVDSEKEYLAIIAKNGLEQRRQLDKLNAQTAMQNEAIAMEQERNTRIHEAPPVGDYLTKPNEAYGMPDGWQDYN